MHHIDDARFRAALKFCSAEQIHIPGAIQTHGALIALDVGTQKIRYASENTDELLRVRPESLLGKHVSEVFGKRTNNAFQKAMVLREVGSGSIGLGAVQFGDRFLEVTISGHEDYIIFEFEAHRKENRSGTVLTDLDFIIPQLRNAKTQDELFEHTVDALQIFTGFDRVAVCKFDNQRNLQVLAERVMPGLPVFDKLTFPASDIPDQAYSLMAKVPLRIICNTADTPAQILSAHADLPELDLSQSILRATSRVHAAYLQNMGALGSLTLNILQQGKLWGVIALHHGTPRYPGQTLCRTSRCVADCLAMKLEILRQSEVSEEVKRVENHAYSVKKFPKGKASPDLEDTALQDLCRTMNSDGVAILQDGRTQLFGLTPQSHVLKSFIRDLGPESNLTVCENIGADFAGHKTLLKTGIGGFLSVRISTNCRILFFRKSESRVVKWAGSNSKILAEVDDKPCLAPRSSFDPVAERIENVSKVWSDRDIGLAKKIHTTLPGSPSSQSSHVTHGDESSPSAQKYGTRISEDTIDTQTKTFGKVEPNGVPKAERSGCLIVEDCYIERVRAFRIFRKIGFRDTASALDIPDALAKLGKFRPAFVLIGSQFVVSPQFEALVQNLKRDRIHFAAMHDNEPLRDLPSLINPLSEIDLRRHLMEEGI